MTAQLSADSIRESTLHPVFVGSDPETANLVEQALQLRWPDATLSVASTERQGWRLIEWEMPDLVVVYSGCGDITLEDFLTGTRRCSNVPIMVLSHCRDVMETVTVMDSGADECVRLPCDLTELMVRMWALLRRVCRTHHNSKSPLAVGALTLRPESCQAFLHQHKIQLTLTEYRLLYLLMTNRGHVVHDRTIEQAICPEAGNPSVIVRKYIQRLRKKLGDDPRAPVWISSVRGVGYRFLEEESAGSGRELA